MDQALRPAGTDFAKSCPPGNLAHGAACDRVRGGRGQALPLTGSGVGEIGVAGVGRQGQRQRDDAAGQDVDRPICAK